MCVDVSQNVTISFVEYAMNSPCCGRAMDEELLVSGTSHFETVDPVDDSNCLIVLPDTTKRWLFDQRRPVLYHGVSVTRMCGWCNSIALRRVFRCYHPIFVEGC